MKKTDNVRISGKLGLIPPVIMMEEMPITSAAQEVVYDCRESIHNILYGEDDRLVVLVGPCSIHDMDAALEYGARLTEMAKQYQQQLCIVMRVYFEKPRTTVGWKGFINDPKLDGSFAINRGLSMARELLIKLSDGGLPCGTEFLDVICPQYLGDLIAWGAIGARTTESQVHRELASGLSAPIGFKNGTDGDVQIAVDAVGAARASHHFLSVTKQGNTAIFSTEGNHDSHIILRGGKGKTNYDQASVDAVAEKLADLALPNKVMIDCSHGNSQKDYRRQLVVAEAVCQQIAAGQQHIMGVMLESHLIEGNQSIKADPLTYGQSVTDACISWEMTLPILAQLAEAVEKRRALAL